MKHNKTGHAPRKRGDASAPEFAAISPTELAEILSLTIKQDDSNKVATFLCLLSAYTEEDQINVSFNAPSSTGKSFIPTEIARLFPAEDVRELGHCTPTAFFYDTGEFDKERNEHLVDLSRKIIVFLDQPHNELLARLRPILSHDKKEISIKMTDKSQKAGTRTKNVRVIGYPSVVFCTAGLRIDEQEATRFLLLSPQTSQDKLLSGIRASILRSSDVERYTSQLEANPARAKLKERIRSIRDAGIKRINIGQENGIERRFLAERKSLKPRHQRDVKRLLSLIKSFALLNLWGRERREDTITANAEDVEAGFRLWEAISASQELNMPPYVYEIYREVILPAWRGEGESGVVAPRGLTRQEILDRHHVTFGRPLDGNTLRMQILPMLESADLIRQQGDPSDRRKMLVFPSRPEGRSSVGRGGVKDEGDATPSEAIIPALTPLTATRCINPNGEDPKSR